MSHNLRKLDEIYESNGRDYTLGLFDKFIVVREKLKGTGISFMKVGDKFEFYKANSNKNISILDRTLQSIYEQSINHINSLPQDIKDTLDNYRFSLRYFPLYSSDRPTNGLILEDVRKLDAKGKLLKFVEDPKILEYFAYILEVENTPIVYYGRMNKLQKTIISDGIDNTEKTFEGMKKLFGSNESISEGFTFKFLDRVNETISAKILNPKVDIKVKKKSRKPSDTYAIALQDILEFMQTVNMDKFVAKGDDREQRILNLISDLYSSYISKNGSKYEGMEDLDGPNFSKNIPEFGVNLKFVINKNTKNYLEKSQINKELFKLFLGTFMKKRSKTSILIDENMRKEINKIVNMLRDKTIDKPENKESIPTFEDYYYNKYQKRALFENTLSLEEEYLIAEGVEKDLVHKEQGKKPVNIIVGRFQPPTLGHIKLLRKLNAQNSLPCVVVQVRSNSGKNQHFDDQLITKIWMDIAKQYNFIEGVKETTTGFLVPVLNALRPQYEPVLWGTGTDRYKDYVRMIDRYGPECNCLEDFRPFEVKRGGKNISATKVREALIAGSEKEFKKLTPTAEHKYYEQLKNEIAPQ